MIPGAKSIGILLLTLFMSVSIEIAAQKTYVVSVGVGYNRDNIENRPNLPYDAKGVAKFFRDYNESEVFMLLDANATRSHILRVLKEQFAKSTEADEIIFFYSGHGFDGGVSTYNNNEAIWCSEVQEIMHKAKARRKVMFVNACHSGSFTKQVKNKKSRHRGYNKKSSVMLFLSSRDSEYSYAGCSATDYSIFVLHLLDGLKGYADNNGDKKVTARELFNYVAPRVTRSTASFGAIQHPVMYGKFPDDMVVVYVP